MSDIVLREATSADAATIVSLIHAAFEEYRESLEPPSGAHKESVESIRAKLEHAQAVLAHIDAETAGCVFYERSEDHVYLSRLAVHPAFRRRGVGRALIDYVESRAAAMELPRVRLGTRIALPQNRAFYERLGYRVVGYGRHAGSPEPTFVWMEKEV